MDKVYLLVERRDYYLDDYENDYYETILGVFDPATFTYDIRGCSINEFGERVTPVAWQPDEPKEDV